MQDRPSPEVASELRSRYKAIAGTKRKAAAVLKSTNEELAAEVYYSNLQHTFESFIVDN